MFRWLRQWAVSFSIFAEGLYLSFSDNGTRRDAGWSYMNKNSSGSDIFGILFA